MQSACRQCIKQVETDIAGVQNIYLDMKREKIIKLQISNQINEPSFVRRWDRNKLTKQ